MKFDEIKEKFDGKKIGEIEKEIDSSRELSTMAEKEFISALAYLERTNRFKENPRFKASSFADYINDRFALSFQKYHGLRLAYVKFEQEAKTYGPGVVLSAISRTGGVEGAERVFKEARRKEEQKGSPLKRETISNLILKHQRPKIDYRAKAEEAKEKAVEAKQEQMAVIAELETKDQQIERLKAAVKRLEAENAFLLAENKRLKDKMVMVTGISDFAAAYPLSRGGAMVANVG